MNNVCLILFRVLQHQIRTYFFHGGTLLQRFFWNDANQFESAQIRGSFNRKSWTFWYGWVLAVLYVQTLLPDTRKLSFRPKRVYVQIYINSTCMHSQNRKINKMLCKFCKDPIYCLLDDQTTCFSYGMTR